MCLSATQLLLWSTYCMRGSEVLLCNTTITTMHSWHQKALGAGNTRVAVLYCSAQCTEAQRRFSRRRRSSGQTCGKTTAGCHLSPCLAPGACTLQWMSLKPLLPTLWHTVLYTHTGCHLSPPDICAWSRGWRVGCQLTLCCYFCKTEEICEMSGGGSQLDHSWMWVTPGVGPRCEKKTDVKCFPNNKCDAEYHCFSQIFSLKHKTNWSINTYQQFLLLWGS